MKTETIKKLLEIGFTLSTWYDGHNSHPSLIYNLGFDNDYELWIEYKDSGYTLEGIDFVRELKIETFSELEILIKSITK